MLKLGWDLVFTIINLIVLYLLLRKFLVKPVLGIMEKRKDMIASQLADAAAKEEEAGRMKQQYEQTLAASRQESEKIVEQARKEAKAEYTRILQEADGQAGQILDNARRSVEAQREKTLREMKSQIAALAMEAAEKITRDSADASRDSAVYDGFIAETGDET